MIVAQRKPLADIIAKLEPYRKIIVAGCETCVAECVHFCLGLLSLGAFALCRSGWMVCIVAVYILLGNLPFQIIQRYNRPRLLRLMRKARKEK